MASKAVLLIENDALFIQAMKEALKAVAPDTAIENVADAKAADKWLEEHAEGKPETPKPAEIVLMVVAAESFKTPAEVEAFRGRLVAAGMKADVRFLVATFEPPATAVPKWMNSGAYNLLIKPADLLLLQEHLRYVLSEKGPPSEHAVHAMQTDAVIEMLKTVPMETLSEIGFVTRSDRALPLGRVTRFYGKVFVWRELMSIYARTLWQDEQPGGKEWKVALTWFGTGRDQLLQIRARFPKTKDVKVDWRKPVPPGQTRLLIIGDPSAPGSELSGTLSRAFPTADIHPMAGIPDPKTPVPAPITAVLVHRDLLEKIESDPRFKDVPHIVMTEKTLKDEDYRALADRACDIITLPVERVSFMKKMAVLFPALLPAEDSAIHNYPWAENLDVGQPVQIAEMSEAGLVLHYERPLPVGSLRRFVLWMPMEVGMPVLTGRVFMNRPDPSKPGFHLNHFVFFGMADHEIKHVRLWMRDNYILSKQK